MILQAKYKTYIPYIIVVVAITLPWFLKFGYLFFTDFSIGPNIPLDFFSNGFLTNFSISVFSLFHFYGFGQKVFIAAIFLIVLLGGKKIADFFVKDYWLAFLVSLFFLFNPFVYDRALYGQMGVIAAFGFLCLSLGFLLEYTKKKAKKQIIVAGLCAGLSVQFSAAFIFFFGFAYLVLAIIFLVEKFPIWQVVKNTLAICAIILVINANWLIGLFNSSSQLGKFIENGIQQNDLIAFQTSGSNGISALANVVMMSGFWGKDQQRYFDLTLQNQNWGRSFLLLMPLMLWGLLYGLKEKKLRNLAIGLLVLFFVSVVLAVGVRLPISREITYWLFSKLPFYKGLRETQKWVSLVVVAYGAFLALGLSQLFSKKMIWDNKLLNLVVVSGVIIMQAPLLLFGFWGQVKPVDYPKDWQEINSYIVNDQKAEYGSQISLCNGSILFLPWHMYMGFGWMGRVTATPAKNFFSCPVVQGTNMEWGGIYDNSGDFVGQKVEDWIDLKGSLNMLKEYIPGLSYVILAKEVDWAKYSWIDGVVGLEPVKETQNLKLYKILH